MFKPPIIIIGMHRSGTTLLTKLLEDCGLFVGAKKYMNYESVFFQQINKWILTQANTTWDNPIAFKYINTEFNERVKDTLVWHINSRRTKQYLGIKKMLKYNSLQKLDFCWGWKDPVNTLTLDLWKAVFPQALIINIVRNPVDVAISLKTREEKRIEKFSKVTGVSFKEKHLDLRPAYNQSYRVLHLEEGVRLALDYMKINEGHLKKYTHSYQLTYEGLLENPAGELSSLFDFISLKPSSTSFQKAIETIRMNNAYKFMNNDMAFHLFEKLELSEVFERYNFTKP